MINITQDIHSLTDFRKNTADFVQNLKRTKRPTILTVNGKAELVVIDAATYQKISEKIEFGSAIAEIDQSLKDFSAKKFSPAKQVLDDLKKRVKKPAAKKSKH